MDIVEDELKEITFPKSDELPSGPICIYNRWFCS